MGQSSIEKIEREKTIKLPEEEWVRCHEVRERSAKINFKRKSKTKRDDRAFASDLRRAEKAVVGPRQFAPIQQPKEEHLAD